MIRARLFSILLTTAVLTVLSGGAANAHGGDEDAPAIDLVRQAIAYIVNTPGDMDTITDKVTDAIEAEDTAGVDVALVEDAMAALGRNDMMAARSSLQEAIGATPDMTGTDVHPILQVPAGSAEVELATGEQTGTTIIVDPLPGRDDLTGADVIMLIVAGLLGVTGAYLARRWRPHDTVRRLRSHVGTPIETGES